MAEGIGLLNQRIVFYTMGSNPISSVLFGDVVQLVERMLCKHEVTGSSPVISTFLISRFLGGVVQLVETGWIQMHSSC